LNNTISSVIFNVTNPLGVTTNLGNGTKKTGEDWTQNSTWYSPSFTVNHNGTWQWAYTATDNQSNQVSATGSFYIIINTTNINPWFGTAGETWSLLQPNLYMFHNASFNVNVSAGAGTYVKYCNATLELANGSIPYNNLNMTRTYHGNYDLWNLSMQTRYATSYNYSVKCYNGYTYATASRIFEVIDEWKSTREYTHVITDVPNEYGTNLTWNLSLWHNSIENLNFTISVGNPLGSYLPIYLTPDNKTKSIECGLSNQTNPCSTEIRIYVNASVPDGEYFGNLTLTRVNDSASFNIPLYVASNPPAGMPTALNKSFAKCVKELGNCKFTPIITTASPPTETFYINNTGNYTLSNCFFIVSTLSDLNASFNPNRFNLSVAQKQRVSVQFTAPTQGHKEGEIQVNCQATRLGYNQTLHPNNTLQFDVDVQFSYGPGGESGGKEEKKEEETFIVGDKICDKELGENLGNSPDCVVCGDMICSRDYGENIDNCPKDCGTDFDKYFLNCFECLLNFISPNESHKSKCSACIIANYAFLIPIALIFILILIYLYITRWRKNE